MDNTQYLYCVNEDGDEDFITISYTFVNSIITIFNFNQYFNMRIVKYAAVDYSSDPFVSFNGKWTNSNALSVYNVEFIDEDIDRMTVRLKVLDKLDKFNLQSYKRNLKINNIIS